MSETWYEVVKWSQDIVPIQVASQTARTVQVVCRDRKPRRSAKRTDWYEYYPTYTEAREAIIEREYKAVIAALEKLDHAQQQYREAGRIPLLPTALDREGEPT
jgi:hypothetical protein